MRVGSSSTGSEDLTGVGTVDSSGPGGVRWTPGSLLTPHSDPKHLQNREGGQNVTPDRRGEDGHTLRYSCTVSGTKTARMPTVQAIDFQRLW
jgi:hypothetical protein